MNSLDYSWSIVTKIDLLESQMIDVKQIEDAFNELMANNISKVYEGWYLEALREQLTTKIIPEFWLRTSKKSSDNYTTYTYMFKAVQYLHNQFVKWLDNCLIDSLFQKNFDRIVSFQTKMKTLLKSLLLSSLEPHFNDCILVTYSYGFLVSRNMNELKQSFSDVSKDENGLDISDVHPDPCCQGFQGNSNLNESEISGDGKDWSIIENKEENCKCDQVLKLFVDMNKYLRDMDLLEVICSDAVSSVIHTHIEKYILQKCQKSFEVLFLNKLENWIQTTVIGWTRMVIGDDLSQIGRTSNERLMYFMYETYSEIRIKQMFDIIIEFPDSEPALEDLKECLQKCHGSRAKVIQSIKSSFEARLLHPGVSTNDILTAYIQTIKSLKVLDPSGVILQLVCDPIKKYLKEREDTVRCIITALTDETSELVPELAKEPPQSLDDGNLMNDDEYISKNWRTWKPDPVDAAKLTYSSKSIRFFDIVSILVNIYESKDLFVEEYQRLFAQRFLQNFDCNVDHERRNLELLTLRFGESDLHSCEVMLQDISSSKRIDNRINAGEIEAYHFTQFPIKCLIISAQFWPDKLGLTSTDEANKIKLPSAVNKAIETYTKAFETIKGSRTLNWLKHFGIVELDLEFNDRKMTFNVSPIHATIIYHFQEKNCWSLSELSQCISVPTAVVRRKMTLWQNKGIIKETGTDKYVLIEEQSVDSDKGPSKGSLGDDYEEYLDESIEDALGNPNSEKQDIEEMMLKVYWSFIENMLTNLNSVSLERMHSMLQMFALQRSNEGQLTIQQLRHFLDKQVKEQKLVYSMGQYKLANN